MRIELTISKSLSAAALCAVLHLASPAVAPADDGCMAVHAAYQKMNSTATSQNVKNSGKANVTNALGAITSGDYEETCKLLRAENMNGEPAQVYSDEFKSKAGQAHGTVWISKKSGATLRQDVDVDMGAAGQGHQSITFEYKKK